MHNIPNFFINSLTYAGKYVKEECGNYIKQKFPLLADEKKCEQIKLYAKIGAVAFATLSIICPQVVAPVIGVGKVALFTIGLSLFLLLQLIVVLLSLSKGVISTVGSGIMQSSIAFLPTCMQSAVQMLVPRTAFPNIFQAFSAAPRAAALPSQGFSLLGGVYYLFQRCFYTKEQIEEKKQKQIELKKQKEQKETEKCFIEAYKELHSGDTAASTIKTKKDLLMHQIKRQKEALKTQVTSAIENIKTLFAFMGSKAVSYTEEPKVSSLLLRAGAACLHMYESVRDMENSLCQEEEKLSSKPEELLEITKKIERFMLESLTSVQHSYENKIEEKEKEIMKRGADSIYLEDLGGENELKVQQSIEEMGKEVKAFETYAKLLLISLLNPKNNRSKL